MVKLTLSDVAKHDGDNDAWMAINGVVWDVTGFAERHPGGDAVIREKLGGDGTAAYNMIHGPGLIAKYLGPGRRRGELAGYDSEQDRWGPAGGAPGPSTEAGRALPPLSSILNLADFEAAAARALPERAWITISGAANDCLTRDGNAALYRRILLRPRVLRDVAACGTGCSLLGHGGLGMPILNAPASSTGQAHRDGELAIARAAAAVGAAVMVPHMASYPADEIVAALPDRHPWLFQLYMPPDRREARGLLDEARRLGASAVVLTADLAVNSKREAKMRYDARAGRKGGSGTQPITTADLTWADVGWVRQHSGLPVIVKGIQTAADARLALHHGCAGIYVSNHGGRAADTAQPAILTLLDIQAGCPEVLDRLEVIIDGGIRRGSDVLKALCLGASAVCLGRPFFYAAVYGEEGVRHLYKTLRDELQVAMQLVGITSLSEASPDLLNTADVDHLVNGAEGHPWARKIVRSSKL